MASLARTECVLPTIDTLTKHACSFLGIGHSSSSFGKYEGPFNHFSEAEGLEGETPQLKASAGFGAVSTHLH